MTSQPTFWSGSPQSQQNLVTSPPTSWSTPTHGQQYGGGVMRNSARVMRSHPYAYSYASPAHLANQRMQQTQPPMMSPYQMSQPMRSSDYMTSSHKAISTQSMDSGQLMTPKLTYSPKIQPSYQGLQSLIYISQMQVSSPNMGQDYAFHS
jgi:hypothetical protein